MSGPPFTPVIASTQVPPPVLQLPWGTVGPNGDVTLTSTSFEFLQLLWAALQGQGGVFDATILGIPAAGVTQALAQGLIADDGRAPALDGGALGALAAVLSAPRPFGVTFTCTDISTKPLSTIVARAPAGINWNMPVGLAHSCGKVTTGPSAPTAFDLQVDGVSVGTATWAAAATVPTFTKAAPSIVRETDFLDLVTPANLNGMAGAFGLTVMGTQR